MRKEPPKSRGRTLGSQQRPAAPPPTRAHGSAQNTVSNEDQALLAICTCPGSVLSAFLIY